jgi:hypothetical protein
LAHLFSERDILAASFFFKRGESDRAGTSKLFTTIASQLSSRVPETALYIRNAIQEDPAISSKRMGEQFEKLIRTPLSNVPATGWDNRAPVVVIDALDECERDKDIKILIKLLSNAKVLHSPRLKIFLNSRPELPIRVGFKAISQEYHQDFILHEIIESIIEHDIFVFLKHELQQIQHEYNQSVPTSERHLPDDWPSLGDVQILTKMAAPLFIFAAPACRFVADRKGGAPNNKLAKVLQHRTKSQQSKLDAICLRY